MEASWVVLEEAATALDRSGGVGVKALEWVEITQARSAEDPRHEPTGSYEATTPFGIYSVEMYFGSDSYGWQVTFGIEETIADCDDPNNAKAAAQADFERRIISALVDASDRASISKPAEKQQSLLDLVGELGRQVFYLLDDCETSGPAEEETHRITTEGLKAVSAVLDQIDDLPYEEPGYILGPGAKLQAALKQEFFKAKTDPAAIRREAREAALREALRIAARVADQEREAECEMAALGARRVAYAILALIDQERSDGEGGT